MTKKFNFFRYFNFCNNFLNSNADISCYCNPVQKISEHFCKNRIFLISILLFPGLGASSGLV